MEIEATHIIRKFCPQSGGVGGKKKKKKGNSEEEKTRGESSEEEEEEGVTAQRGEASTNVELRGRSPP